MGKNSIARLHCACLLPTFLHQSRWLARQWRCDASQQELHLGPAHVTNVGLAHHSHQCVASVTRARLVCDEGWRHQSHYPLNTTARWQGISHLIMTFV